MNHYRVLLLTVALVLTIFCTLSTSISARPVIVNDVNDSNRNYQLHPRIAVVTAPTDLSKVKTGLLVKDGRQTSCALAPIDSQSAMISADCFKLNDKGQLDGSSRYDVYLTPGEDNKVVSFPVEFITFHPNYDPNTKANNIAVLRYNSKEGDVSWINYSAIGYRHWDNLLYSQEYLSSVKDSKWAAPSKYIPSNFNPNSTDPECTKLSSLYKTNQDDMVCTGEAADPSSPDLHLCKAPYQMVYTVIDQSLYQAGLYSHSVLVDGSDDLCKKAPYVRHYYTLLADYLSFASTAINRQVKYYRPPGAADSVNNDPNFQMHPPSGASSPDSSTVISGDLYTRQTGNNFVELPPPPSTPVATQGVPEGVNVVPGVGGPSGNLDGEVGISSTSHKSGEGVPELSLPDSSSNGDGGDGSGLLQRDVIIIAVTCSIGGIILAIGLFFFIRWLVKHKKNKQNSSKEASNQLVIANDLGGARMPNDDNWSASQLNLASPQTAYYPQQSPPAYPADERPPSHIVAGIMSRMRESHGPPFDIPDMDQKR